MKYLYDSLDRISELQYNIGKLGWFETVCFYRYTIDGQLAAIEDYTENTVTSTVFQTNSSYTYVNVEPRVTTALVESHTSTVKNQQGQTLGSTVYRYTYDENGNITAIRNNSNEVVAEFSYDSLGQLTEENRC